MARARTLGEVHQVRSPFEPLLSLLDEAWAVSIAEAIADGLRSRWLERVVAAREDWVSDFGGEQFALGRAFYTHLESEQATRYFHDAAASDATVERHLPGMQAELQRLFAACVGGQARRRLGYCGAGVHIFPAGENVARHGGVIHWDVEGLAPLALERETAALTLVVMLQVPARGGGLRLWDACYDGHDEPSPALLARRFVTHRYAFGEAMLMSSYRLHQIRPFRGSSARISITLHGVEIDEGVWETWF